MIMMMTLKNDIAILNNDKKSCLYFLRMINYNLKRERDRNNRYLKI